VDSGPLKKYLKEKGTTLIGVGDITIALTREIVHLNRGIALAVNRGLNRDTNAQLVLLQQWTEGWLKKRGFRSLSVPPDSDKKKSKYISRLYHLVSHKTAATLSGLGWIGKNGLLINGAYGSRLSWATVLTDAPFGPDLPITKSECGECELCVKYCPSGAVQGHLWSMDNPLQELVVYEKCRSLKKERPIFDEKPNCGLCITICPYSRNGQK